MARGFETITTGQLVSTATINDKFIKQGVIYFADATARDAAIASPEEGMRAYLADADVVTYYDGSSWVLKGGVTAAGDLVYFDGTSWTHLTPTTAGDVAYFDGTDWVRLGIGTAAQVLQVNPGATAPQWADGATSAFQLVGSVTTEQSTTSTTEVTVASLSSLSINTAVPLRIVVTFRRSGSSGSGAIGLKLNSTVVCDTTDRLASLNIGADDHGMATIDVAPRLSDYPRAGMVHGVIWGEDGSPAYDAENLQGLAKSAAIPTATITDIAIVGKTDSGTLYIGGLYVYKLSGT